METMTDASALHDAGFAVAAPALPAEGAGASLRDVAGDLFALTKPRMNFLVVVTTMVGYYMASRGWGGWSLLLHTLLGTAITAAGASVLNQYSERTFDGLMDRTSGRPLPAGRIAPAEALLLGVVLSIAGMADLMFFVNPLTALLGAATLGSYVFVYTPMKRRTTLCTVAGAIPGALPPVMGWAAATGTLAPPVLSLFGILFFWQLPHFLAIAILYRDDYARGGFKMLPVLDPNLRATGRQMVLWSLALIPVSLLPSVCGIAGPVYFVSAVLLGLIFTGFGLACALWRTRPAARHLFFASIVYLPFLLTSMMLDKL